MGFTAYLSALLTILTIAINCSEASAENDGFLRQSRYRQSCTRSGGYQSEYHQQNDPCSTQDLNQKIANFGDCSSYLQCTPNNCRWTFKYCPAGKFFNHVEKQCASPVNANCAASIFGRQTKATIMNVKFQVILDDSRKGGNSWDTESDVIGFETNSEPIWNQILVTKRRDPDSAHYSLAFDKKENGQVKVVTASGNQVVSKLLEDGSDENTHWIFVPVEGRSWTFQIVNPATGFALTMAKNTDGDDEFQVYLDIADAQQTDETQHWQIHEYDGKRW